jgi:hypothetical protein
VYQKDNHPPKEKGKQQEEEVVGTIDASPSEVVVVVSEQEVSNVTKQSLAQPSSSSSKRYQKKGRVFTCGYLSSGETYFPDYTYMGEWDTEEYPVTTTGNDLLIIGAFGPCHEETKLKYILQDYFAGKVLYIMGEPYGNVFWNDHWTPVVKQQHITIPTTWWDEILAEQQQKKVGTNEEEDVLFHPHISRVFQIGPYPPIPPKERSSTEQNASSSYQPLTVQDIQHQVYHTQSLPVFYGTVTIAHQVHEFWPLLSDPTQKPYNNGKYTAIAWISRNCAPHRVTAAQYLSQHVPIPVYNGGKCAVSTDYHPHNQPMPSEFQMDRVKRGHNHLIFQNFK